jgi:hypothetical protein
MQSYILNNVKNILNCQRYDAGRLEITLQGHSKNNQLNTKGNNMKQCQKINKF